MLRDPRERVAREVFVNGKESAAPEKDALHLTGGTEELVIEVRY